jgi:hypothetical protein
VESMLYGSLMAVLLLMQAMIIYEFIRMKGHVSTESSSLRTAMADMGSLLDEALDYIAELADGRNKASPIVQGAGESIQQMLLTGLMNKMMMPPSDSNGTESTQERSVHQIEETNE